MRKIIVLLFIISINSQAQVGINTTNPDAQLDIRSSNQATPSNNDGILIPKIDAFPAINPTAAQQGMLVYLTTPSGTDMSGFYYWDNNTLDWKPIAGASLGTLDQAYDFGGAGNGRTITADAGAVTINGTDGLVSIGGIFGSGTLAPSGDGIKMVWNPRKAAFRAGFTSANGWDDANIGDYSVAFNEGTRSTGRASFSTGGYNFALANFAQAAGYQNTAFSYGETVLGIGATFYSTTVNGTTQFRTANANDRLFVVGNAIDSNNNTVVDNVERSDALVILKNGLTRLPSTTNTMISAADGKAVVTKEYLQSNNWSLTGNTGTNSTINFIGTADDVDVIFKRNNVQGGLISIDNTAFGNSALVSTTGLSNAAFGRNALFTNTLGNGNTAIGGGAMLNNLDGDYNVGIGLIALRLNTSGNENVALGYNALGTNTLGSNNTAIGFLSDVASNNLTNATAIGNRAEVGASNSLVLGSVNGVNGATSSVNVGIGTTTPDNKLHLADNSTSTTIGQLYLEQQGTGDALLHIGNTGARHFNLGLDTSEDKFKIGTSATTATAVTTGTLMTLQPTGEVGIGITTPAEKLHVSGPAGLTAVRIGNTSGVGATSNVALDFFRNTAINTDWRIYNIGANLTVGNSGDDLATVNDLYQFQGNRFMPMNDGTQNLGQAANRWNTVFATNGTINTSDRREKKEIQPLHYGLNQLMQLKPVTFKWNNSQVDNGSKHLGFIAQDLQGVLPEVVVDSEWVEEDGNKVWKKAPLLGVNYAEVIPVLVQSIQEQQAIIQVQKKEIENQKATLEIVLQRLAVLEKK